ncbi:MAG: Hsp20/alpha crystallin family protein [Pseudomonadales bacterium]
MLVVIAIAATAVIALIAVPVAAKGVLTIVGERKPDLSDKDEQTSLHINERFAGRFRRVVSLPDNVNPNAVEAKYRDGVLHISIQRLEAAQRRQISIQ